MTPIENLTHFDLQHHSERRARSLTDADIAEIVAQINKSKHLDCRFESISVDDLEEAIKFYKNFNTFMAESRGTIWKALLVLGVGGTFGLIILGVYAKIRENIL